MCLVNGVMQGQQWGRCSFVCRSYREEKPGEEIRTSWFTVANKLNSIQLSLKSVWRSSVWGGEMRLCEVMCCLRSCRWPLVEGQGQRSLLLPLLLLPLLLAYYTRTLRMNEVVTRGRFWLLVDIQVSISSFLSPFWRCVCYSTSTPLIPIEMD